ISAFATRELALGTGVLCHLCESCLDATLLGRATAVVRDRRDVRDARDLETTSVEGADCTLSAGARPANSDFNVLHAVFLRRDSRLLSRHLRRERRRLARTAEAATTRRRPGKR